MDKSILLKRLQLGMIHVAVAMTLVPINSTLNRVMINELNLSATLVALLASLPFLFSPMQMWVGAISDRVAWFGYRRSPAILIGLLLCVLGVAVSPWAAFTLAGGGALGWLAGIIPFLLWGMGYNFASVSYLALATDLSGEKQRGGTIAVMWFMMIVSIIFTAITLGRMVEGYSPEILQRAFVTIALAALGLGLLGLLGLEPRQRAGAAAPANTPEPTPRQMWQAIGANRQARTFFIYLTLLLAAILGQDVLLEPFAAQAFGWSVAQTTRLTSLWGTAVLAMILLATPLERWLSRKTVAQIGNLGAMGGFVLLLAGGTLGNAGAFYAGVILLGCGTGLSTVANLALMFDLTLPGQVGLYIGAWGFSNALSRLTGSLLGGVVRDAATWLSGNALLGYALVFAIEAAILVVASLMLRHIDVGAFRKESNVPTALERAALAE